MKKGDRIVCIKDAFFDGRGLPFDKVKKGDIFTVVGSEKHPLTGGLYLHLDGFNPLVHVFDSRDFRKIDEQKLSNATTKELAGWAKEHVEQERTPKKIRIFTTEAEF